MNRLVIIALGSVAVVGACASSPGSEPAPNIEVRRSSGVPVSGTAFSCTDHASTTLTPCEVYPSQRSALAVRSDAQGVVDLVLSRNISWITVDGAAAAAVVSLQFLLEGEILATARQDTYTALGIPAAQYPRGGWIEPVAASRTAEGRNAGRFSLSFDWGTVSGTYDSADAQ